MSNGYVYILDDPRKIIHTVANIVSACKLENISEQIRVYGAHPGAIDRDGWLFCKHCYSDTGAAPAEADDLSAKAEAVFRGAPVIETAEAEEEQEKESKPKRGRRSKDESET